MQLTPRGLLLFSITTLFLLTATFAGFFLWLAAGWFVLACALLLAKRKLAQFIDDTQSGLYTASVGLNGR